MEAEIPIRSWEGLIKNADPADIPPNASPDCENAVPYAGLQGLLGPRFGKALQGISAQTIVGVYPYHVEGQDGVLVAMSNGETVFLAGYGSATPGGSLQTASELAVSSQTIIAGPVNLTLNQFFQVINVQWLPGGGNGVTGTFEFCWVEDFDASDCSFTYGRAAIQVSNGVITNLSYYTGCEVCTPVGGQAC